MLDRHRCNHIFKPIQNSENRKCDTCGYSVIWDYEHEKQYILSVAERDIHISKKREMLNGIITAYKAYESKNTNTQEDTKLIKYAKELLKGLR